MRKVISIIVATYTIECLELGRELELHAYVFEFKNVTIAAPHDIIERIKMRVSLLWHRVKDLFKLDHLFESISNDKTRTKVVSIVIHVFSYRKTFC